MAVGLPYGFAFDADKSGPMARMEAAMAERTFLRWRGLLEGKFLDRIKNIILLDAAARGLIPDSEFLLDGRWCWPAKVSIDYGREANADINLWKAGLKTAGQIYSDMGEDYEEALRARAKESAMIVSLANEMDIPAEYISDSIIPIQAAAPIAAPIVQEEPQLEPIQTEQAKQVDLSDENKPSKGMVEEALKGLKWREEYNRGGTEVGVARARDISNGKNLSDDTVKRMHSFFSRHEVDKKGQGFTPDEDGFPSAGRIAWALWGGDAGQTWAAAKAGNMGPEELVTALRDDFGRITAFQRIK
jgi:hypothetical protein